jgi:hypothetical protein
MFKVISREIFLYALAAENVIQSVVIPSVRGKNFQQVADITVWVWYVAFSVSKTNFFKLAAALEFESTAANFRYLLLLLPVPPATTYRYAIYLCY